MLVPLLRWLAVPFAIVGSVCLGMVPLAIGFIRGTPWTHLSEACLLTGFASVLGAGWAAPKYKTVTKLLAIVAPLTYWLIDGYQYSPIANRIEVIVVILSVVGGGVGAWCLLERMVNTHDA